MQDDRSELGRRLAALRQRKASECAECGAAFEGIGIRRYCSARCRNRASQRAARSRERQRRQPGAPCSAEPG